MTLTVETLSDAGISAAVLETTGSGGDVLTISAPQAIDAAALIAPFEKVTLQSTDGTKRFVGWLDQAPRQHSGSSSLLSYTLNGPMRWLSRVTLVTAGSGGLLQLGVDVAGLAAETTALDENIRFVLDHAIAQTDGAFAYVDADLDATIFQHQIAPEFRIDSSCEALLRRLLKFAPTVSYWWDYTTTVPTIRFADTARETPDKTLSESAYKLASSGTNPRYDLLHDQVQIYWTSKGVLRDTEVTASAGDAATLGADRTLTFTFDLGDCDTPPAGLAAAFAKYYNRLHVDSDARMNSLDWSHRPGHLWSFAGLLANPYTAFCIQVSRDLFRRNQSITLGVPPALDTFGLSSGNSDRGPQKDPPTAAISRTLVDPNDEALVGDSFFVINGQAAASGSSVAVPAGSYAIQFIVPDKYVAPDPQQVVVENTSPFTAEVTTGLADNTAVAPFRSRVRLYYEGTGNLIIDINAADIPAGIEAAKFVLNERCDGKQAWILQTPWATPV